MSAKLQPISQNLIFFAVIGSMLSKLREWWLFSHYVRSDEYSHGFGDVFFRGRIAIRGARLRCQ